MPSSCILYDCCLVSTGREARRVVGQTTAPPPTPITLGTQHTHMAQVSLSPAPHKPGNMSSKRVPLGNVPNAANSPFRSVAAATSKRSRNQVEAQEDLPYDLQPRAKRQALEDGRAYPRISPRKQALQSAEGRIFNKRTINAQPTPFEKKLLASAKENKATQRVEEKVEQRVQQRVERQGKASHEALEDIRQWQRHYKRSFPTFVFYFESLPEEVRIKCSKWIRSLGAVRFTFSEQSHAAC